MKKLIGLLLVIIILFYGCSRDNTEYVTYAYEYRNVIFSIDYPKNWFVEPIVVWDATDETVTDPMLIREGSPERGGIDLYDYEGSDNSINFFCAVSNYSYHYEEFPSEELELFLGKDKIANMRINRDDNGVTIQLWYIKDTNTGYYQALVRVTEEFYDNNEQMIWHILKSLKY